MLRLVRRNKAFGQIGVILVFVIILLILFVNARLRRSIEQKDQHVKPAVSARLHRRETNKRTTKKGSNYQHKISDKTVLGQTKIPLEGSKEEREPDKEIIYEPSIKDNLLLQ